MPAPSTRAATLTEGCIISLDRLRSAAAIERFGDRGTHGAVLIRLAERNADGKYPEG